MVVYLLHVVSVGVDEGVGACEQFVKDGSEGPQVCGVRIALVEEYLRSHVLGSAYEAKGLVLVLVHLLACAQIHKFQVAVPPHHNVLGLQVTVDQRFLAEEFEDVD